MTKPLSGEPDLTNRKSMIDYIMAHTTAFTLIYGEPPDTDYLSILPDFGLRRTIQRMRDRAEKVFKTLKEAEPCAATEQPTRTASANDSTPPTAPTQTA